jgi:hypothetical protein
MSDRRSTLRPLAALAIATAIAFAAPACGSDDEPDAKAEQRPAPDGSPAPGLPPPPPPVVGSPLPSTAPPWDVGSTAATIDAWPRIVPGIHTRALTSFDRGGGNDDGFGGTYSELYVDPKSGEHVIFDEWGPGVLRTLWLTSPIDGNSPLGLGTMRFYFDDDEHARIEVDADALFGGSTPPFASSLVAANHASSGGFASWAPLPYRSRLRVTTAQKVGFYQIHYDALPADWNVTSYAAGSLDTALRDRFDASASSSTLALEQVPLDTEKTGAGMIDVIRFVPETTPSDPALATARITITFDGASTPQVDVPLAFFFGSGFGLAPVRSLVWTIATPPSVLFESRMPMPYWDGVHVRVTGLAGKLFVHRSENTLARGDTGTLEAIFHEARPTPAGDYVYADVSGAGKLVATVLGVDPITAGNKGWWEGDLRTVVDGVRTPAIHGTGHEDDHLGGWSNEFLSRPFTLPMQGAPRTELLDTRTEFQVNGVTTMYRLWPGISFDSGIRHSTEHGPSNARSANYSSVTFLYRQPAPRLVRTDAFDVADTADAVSHGLEGTHEAAALTSAFEGADPAPSTMTVHTYDAPLRFRLAIDRANEGVEVRRLFDAGGEGTSQATMLVEGVRIATIANVGPRSSSRRWTERDVFVPPQVTHGKSLITVEYVPVALFTAARFEAHSVVR